MAVIEMAAEKRPGLGKGGARKARAAGTIPGILYGHGETPVPIAIGARTFQLALQKHKGGNAIVNLAIAGGQYTALIRDVQYDPITHHILHLDFQHISLTEMVEVEVLVHLVGVPSGVKDGGGILETIMRMVEVRCLPTQIPASIDVDVTALAIGDSVHVRDLKVENAEILSDEDATVATVVAPTVMEEKVAEGATSAAEPELAVAKGKKDEDEDEKEKEKKDKK